MEPSINGRLLGMDGYIMVERRRDIEQQFNGKCIHVGQQYLDRRINVYIVRFDGSLGVQPVRASHMEYDDPVPHAPQWSRGGAQRRIGGQSRAIKVLHDDAVTTQPCLLSRYGKEGVFNS